MNRYLDLEGTPAPDPSNRYLRLDEPPKSSGNRYLSIGQEKPSTSSFSFPKMDWEAAEKSPSGMPPLGKDNPLEVVGGVGEAIAGPTAQLAAAPVALSAALGRALSRNTKEGEFGDRFMEGWSSVMGPVDDLMAPQTETGAKLSELLSKVFEAFPDFAGDAAFEVTKNPGSATFSKVVATAMEMGLPLFLGRKVGKHSEFKPKIEASVRATDETAALTPNPPSRVPTSLPGENRYMGVETSELPAARIEPAEPPAPKTVEMGMGVKAPGVEDLPFSFTAHLKEEGAPVTRGGLSDAFLKAFAPAARGEEASEAAGIIRANRAQEARDAELAFDRLRSIGKAMNKLPRSATRQFMTDLQHGVEQKDPLLNQTAKSIRQLLDPFSERLVELGKLEEFNKNYFPNLWRQRAKAEEFLGRRSLTGRAGFLKERYYEDLQAGIDAGLEPLTENPIEAALLRASEMRRYLYGQSIWHEIKAAGLARFFRTRGDAPVGWQPVNDKLASVKTYSEQEGGFVDRGHWYAPEPVARVINNHLSPGLQGNAFFDLWRQSGNMLNSLQLGLSGFHLGFTSADAMISKLALSIQQLSRGQLRSGSVNFAQSFNPVQPFVNLYKGDRLLRQYLGKVKDPDLAVLVDALTQAGGRPHLDPFWRNTQLGAFQEALRSVKYGLEDKKYGRAVRGAVRATKEFLPTVLQVSMKPIFEVIVPRQKLGVFFDLASDWLERHQNATINEKRVGLGRLWDTVDDRMGQLVYDNVFWHRTFKDALMSTVRSVGWNLGTFRQLGGGILDLKQLTKDVGHQLEHRQAKVGDLVQTRGGTYIPKRQWEGLSPRTAYLIALPFWTAVVGSIMAYLYTGKSPETLYDRWFIKTGKTRLDGSSDRVSLPTYWKDIAAYHHDVEVFLEYGEDPFQTLENKAHPLLGTVSEMVKNRDFFGGAIRSPGDPAVQQMIDEGEHILKAFTPFSIRNYQQQQKLQDKKGSFSDYLTSPSTWGVTPSPGYITRSPEQLESAEVSKMRQPLLKKFQQELRDGADVEETVSRMRRAGLSQRDIRYALRSAQDVRRTPREKHFGDQ